MDTYFFGVDIGTQGARVVLVNQHGWLIASEAVRFQLDAGFREEQCPEQWWKDCKMLMDKLMQNLPLNIDRQAIRAISVTSTSGTVIPLDKNRKAIHPALMYSDARSSEQGSRIKRLAEQHVKHGYTGFNASSGISKICWFMETYPEKLVDLDLWVHASDFIVGKLSENYHTTDYTNVLKSAYDIEHFCWPNYILDGLGLKRSWLQEVVPSGTVIGRLTAALAAEWGIPTIAVVVGMTDGCATQVASGAVNPGDWNTTIGTTLVIKGVTKNKLVDPLGRLYSHRHPEGYWMPGGASNTGADWISLDFDEDLAVLNTAAAQLIPTGLLAWPLKAQGERYPIMAAEAVGFAPKDVSKELLYAANLEGVAFIEKLAYEIITELSGEEIKAVFTAGGGSNSDVWLAIRASVLNVPIYKCAESSGALGAAIMAASNSYYDSVRKAALAMCRREKVVLPNPNLVEEYTKQYQLFKQKLTDLKYI